MEWQHQARFTQTSGEETFKIRYSNKKSVMSVNRGAETVYLYTPLLAFVKIRFGIGLVLFLENDRCYAPETNS